MKKYTKIYLKEFDYVMDDFIPCEICSKRAVDIHHIESRGMGGVWRYKGIQGYVEENT
jgi:hypothetical protein